MLILACEAVSGAGGDQPAVNTRLRLIATVSELRVVEATEPDFEGFAEILERFDLSRKLLIPRN